jgi:hypothetical protein
MKSLKLHIDYKISQLITKLIPRSNYHVGSNLIKPSTPNYILKCKRKIKMLLFTTSKQSEKQFGLAPISHTSPHRGPRSGNLSATWAGEDDQFIVVRPFQSDGRPPNPDEQNRPLNPWYGNLSKFLLFSLFLSALQLAATN